MGLDHIPVRLRRDLTPEFWDAYRSLVLAIYAICDVPDSPDIPTLTQILRVASLSTDSRPYVERGARADYAVDLVLVLTESESLLPTGEWDEMLENPATKIGYEEWKALPYCDNDLRFAFVRSRLRLSDTMGPYF